MSHKQATKYEKTYIQHLLEGDDEDVYESEERYKLHRARSEDSREGHRKRHQDRTPRPAFDDES